MRSQLENRTPLPSNHPGTEALRLDPLNVLGIPGEGPFWVRLMKRHIFIRHATYNLLGVLHYGIYIYIFIHCIIVHIAIDCLYH